MQLFGEAVLGLSQGSVSELLSKPKSWQMLSIKGREPFIRMQLWLADPHNINKLQHLKSERRDASKRRRAIDQSHDALFDNSDEFLIPSPGGSSKKARLQFSDEQKEALQLAFALNAYPSLPTVEFLSKELQLLPGTINNWFHNNRMRVRQMPPSPPNGPSDPSIPSLDPLHFRILLSQRLMKLRMGDALHDYELSPESGNDGEDSLNYAAEEESNISNTEYSPNPKYAEQDDSNDVEFRLSSPDMSSTSGRQFILPPPLNSIIKSNESKKQVIINGVCVRQMEDLLPYEAKKSPLSEPHLDNSASNPPAFSSHRSSVSPSAMIEYGDTDNIAASPTTEIDDIEVVETNDDSCPEQSHNMNVTVQTNEEL